MQKATKLGNELTVQVKYNCGCGFVTTKPKEALEHAYTMNHTLDVRGMVGWGLGQKEGGSINVDK